MDNFLRRLKYYGIGFGIGLIFVIILFRQKGCSWTPGNRVKSALLDRIVFIDSVDKDYIIRAKITPEMVRSYFEEGTISFMKSKRHGNEKLYHFHGTMGTSPLDCIVAYREKSVVIDVDFMHDDIKNYERLHGDAQPFLFKEKNWFSGNWSSYKLVGFSKADAPEKFTKLFFEDGQLLSNMSTYDNLKPIDYFQIMIPNTNGRKVKYCMKTRWFQEKIEILELSECKPQ